jgi:hypothetical protein
MARSSNKSVAELLTPPFLTQASSKNDDDLFIGSENEFGSRTRLNQRQL